MKNSIVTCTLHVLINKNFISFLQDMDAIFFLSTSWTDYRLRNDSAHGLLRISKTEQFRLWNPDVSTSFFRPKITYVFCKFNSLI